MNRYFGFFNDRLLLSNGPGKYKITEDALWLSSVIPKDLKSYLDVGCGTGVISFIVSVSNNESSIVGIDIQKEMIDIAREHALLNEINNIKLVNTNLFDVTEGGYDCVFSNPPFLCTKKTDITSEKFRRIAHFQEDIDKFINKMISLANPDGKVCLIVHKTTQGEVKQILKGFYSVNEIELTSKLGESKRIIYVIDKSQKEPSWNSFKVDSTSSLIRRKILDEHESLMHYID